MTFERSALRLRDQFVEETPLDEGYVLHRYRWGAELEHSCDEWVIGGPEEVEDMRDALFGITCDPRFGKEFTVKFKKVVPPGRTLSTLVAVEITEGIEWASQYYRDSVARSA